MKALISLASSVDAKKVDYPLLQSLSCSSSDGGWRFAKGEFFSLFFWFIVREFIYLLTLCVNVTKYFKKRLDPTLEVLVRTYELSV